MSNAKNSIKKLFIIVQCILILFSINEVNAQTTQITTDPADDNDPFWSPDGSELVFWSNRSGNYEIWRIPSTGGEAVQLTNTPHFEMHPCWSPVDSLIAYSIFSNGTSNLWTVNRSGGNPTQITTHPGREESLTWNHNGTEIFYDSDRSGNWDIWKILSDGTSATQITSHQSADIEPTISPNGSLAFRSFRSGGSELWIIPEGTGSLVQVTNDAYEEFTPNCSYQNNYIAYSSNRNGNIDIWIIPFTGGEPIQITTDAGENWYPHWSPDGTKLAFTSDRSGNRDIWIIDVSTLVDIEYESESFPDKFELHQNYPNPFNPTTKIRFTVPNIEMHGHASLQLIVYDVLCNEITTLIDEQKPVGEYEIVFDGSELPSGIYFYSLSAGNLQQTKKMILLK